MNAFRGASVVAMCIWLVGCSPTASEAPSATAPPPSPSVSIAAPSPSVSASPPADNAPATQAAAAAQDPCADPSVSLVGLAGIDFNRYANICLGMSFAQASSAAQDPTIIGDAVCPWYATLLDFSDPGFHVGAVTNPDNPGAAISLFRMTWQSDQQSAVDFDAPSTPAGISVGSTTAQVKAAYPGSTDVVVNDPARGTRNQIVVNQPGGAAFAFDVTEGFVTDIYWGSGVSQGAGGELCAL